MNVLEKNRKRNRLPHYDYSQSGYYSLTICTKHMETHFGVIENGNMKLSEEGRIIEECWKEITRQYKNLSLDEYQIMPNHLHGILIINEISVGTIHELSREDKSNNFQVKRRKMILPIVIGRFKMNASRKIHQWGKSNFSWQRSYYDHVIRNEKSLLETRKYVVENPLKLEFDKNNPINFKTELKDNS